MAVRNKGAVTGSSAAAYGCIATFENADGLIVTRHASGPPLRALRRLCDHVASFDPTYRLVCYSSPQTILGTLTGGRAAVGEGAPKRRNTSVEKLALSRAGRAHMAHPRCGA